MTRTLTPALTLALALALFVTPAFARDSLGVFDGWAAFRDPAAPRCYAIAEPARSSPDMGDRRGFASVGTWPEKGVRAQLHIRLSRPLAAGSRLYLSIGERRFALLTKENEGEGWAQDTHMDRAIVAAMRMTRTMSVEGAGKDGRPFYDLYVLKGAATAMDAASLGCAR